MKIKGFLQILTILLLSFALTNGQVYLIQNVDPSIMNELAGYGCDVTAVTNEVYLILGSHAEKSSLRSRMTKLDETWDDVSYYYILYPLRSHDSKQLSLYGQILFNSKEFIIFKSSHDALHDFSVFDPYEIAGITKNNTMPQLNMGNDNPTDLPRGDYYNDKIQTLVDNVSEDSIWTNMGRMTKMERYTTAAAATTTAGVLRDVFKNSYLYDSVALQTYTSGYSPNVIAIKWGKDARDSIYIVGGHYDSYTKGAPGADDNASGAATTMEAARVLAKSDFRKTLVYILFSGEELGFKGSAAYVQKSVTDKTKICGMINIDVDGYRWDKKVQIETTYDDRSKDLYDGYLSLIKKYLPTVPTYDGYSSPYKNDSDNKSFWAKGFKALMTNSQLDPSHINPLMHTANDVMETSANCKGEPAAVTKAIVAALCTWAELKDNTGLAQADHPLSTMSFNAVYNPHTGKLSLKIPATAIAGNLTIVNSRGRTVYFGGLQNGFATKTDIDWHGQAAGMYYLMLTDKNLRISRPFVNQ